MRSVKLLFLLVSVTMLFINCASEHKLETTSEKGKEITTTKAKGIAQQISLTVDGMTWGISCVARVRSALTKVDGVVSAKVSMPDKAIVKIDPNKVKNQQLISAIKNAGYSAIVSNWDNHHREELLIRV